MGVLRHELPDQHVLDHRIIASYGLIAPLVTMSCRLLLRRVASPGALPRERLSPMTLLDIFHRRTISVAFEVKRTSTGSGAIWLARLTPRH
jgi:hypothetical protein